MSETSLKQRERQSADRTERKKKKAKRSVFVRSISVFAVLCFVGYSLAMIISQQAQIAQLKKETEEISGKITEAKQENDEYVRLLSEDDESAYMERIAIERLGYAYPDEKRFYIINGD